MDATKNLTMHKTNPSNKDFPTPNLSGAEWTDCLWTCNQNWEPLHRLSVLQEFVTALIKHNFKDKSQDQRQRKEKWNDLIMNVKHLEFSFLWSFIIEFHQPLNIKPKRLTIMAIIYGSMYQVIYVRVLI